MCSNVLPCPLCCQPNFPTVDSLRLSLVSVTNRPLVCPICHDVQMGLDKLTIHLFSHTISPYPIYTHQIATAVPNPPRDAIISHTHNGNEDRQKRTRIKRTLKPTRLPETKSTLLSENPDIQSNQPSPSFVYQPQPIATISNSALPVKIELSEMIASEENRERVQPFVPAEPQCNVCGSTFRNQELHEMHMQLVHQICVNTEDNRVGLSAGTSFLESDANDDASAIVGQSAKSRFQCHLCAKHYKMKGSLRVHLRVVHSVEGVVSTAINSLSYRKSMEPNQRICAGSVPPVGDVVTIEQSVESMNVNCSVVGNNVVKVEQSATMAAPPLIADIVEEVTATSVANGSESKQWECDICTKSFSTKYFLKKHKRLHTGEMPYTCDLCNKTFTFQQSYHKHLLYHNDDKPHVCSICNRAFKELSTLHNHERIHSGEKPFKCETCDKCFRQRVSYLVHRRIHTGVMPYKCTACEKSFRYKVSQRTHTCPAQPPGEVVRQTGDLLQKLIQSSGFNQPADPSGLVPMPDHDQQQAYPNQLESAITTFSQPADTVFHQHSFMDAKLLDDGHQQLSNQSLDEFVAEHCDKIGIGGEMNDDVASFQPHQPVDQCGIVVAQVPSPSEQFRNMCIYSPTSMDGIVAYSPNMLDTMEDSSFKQFLFDNE